jgi:protein-L-isoaspartate(D-aspartate) O-methyltransferase
VSRIGAPARSAIGLGMTSQRARDRLVERLREQGIADPRVLDVMRQTPRHLFIDESLESRAYDDSALPIGLKQTISQPFVVARMTEAVLEYASPRKVLEIGTGSGYQAAVLAPLVDAVYTVERLHKLLREARLRLRKLAITNVYAKHQDGRLGWPEEAPFDAIVITAAGAHVDAGLLEQLALGGVLIAPVGPPTRQRLLRMRKHAQGMIEDDLGPVSFVPLLAGID